MKADMTSNMASMNSNMASTDSKINDVSKDLTDQLLRPLSEKNDRISDTVHGMNIVITEITSN